MSDEAIGTSQANRASEIVELSAAVTSPIPPRTLLAVFVAQLTISTALITPTTYSLAIWLHDVEPSSRDGLLALAVGGSSLLSILLGPIAGALSDHTRLRLGPRRTWLLAGLVLGTAGTTVIVTVAHPAGLVSGWSIAAVGYGLANSMVVVHLRDRLPREQRGKVLGVSSGVVYLGPVVGVLIAGAVAALPPLMFLVPAAAALLSGGLLSLVMTDPAPTSAPTSLGLRTLRDSYWIDPRRNPAYAWVWCNRAVCFSAVSLMTLYTVYFLFENLSLTWLEIAGVVSIGGIIGVAASSLGGVVFGALSDRTASRLPFIVASTVLLTIGLLIIATATGVPQYLLGMCVDSFALGVYSAVGQALQFDVIPAEEKSNGRFLAVMGMANQIPQAVGPFAAAGLLVFLGGGYASMYFAASALVASSLLTIIPLRRHLRLPASSAPTPPPAPIKEYA